MAIKTEATIEDLYKVPENGKAELVNGEIVRISPTGFKPGRVANKILVGLLSSEEEQGGGYAVGDNVGFIVDLPHRKSFSPNAGWYVGEVEGLKFAEGAPVFAVEVRSENDYSPAAERAIAAKINDYFAAGTKVVWDLDLVGEEVIRSYRCDNPEHPTIYRRGDTADAEPAVPGWRVTVDSLLK